MSKFFKGLLFVLLSLMLLAFAGYKFSNLFSHEYFLTADELSYDTNNWQNLDNHGGLASNNAILISQNNHARAKAQINLRPGKYNLWMRFRADPQSGKCKIRIGDKEFFVEQNGNTSVVFKKLGVISLGNGRQDVLIENVSDPNDSINFDFLMLTENLIFRPRITLLGYSPLKERNPAFYILILVDVVLALLIYWVIFCLLWRKESLFSFFNTLRANIKKNASNRFAGVAIVFLILTFIAEINNNSGLADLFSVASYVIFVAAVIFKYSSAKAARKQKT